jgi:hypothetical protein
MSKSKCWQSVTLYSRPTDQAIKQGLKEVGEELNDRIEILA